MKNKFLISAALLATLIACDGKNSITGPSSSTSPEYASPGPSPVQGTPSLGKPYPRSPIGGDPTQSNLPGLIIGKVARTNVTNVRYDFELWEEADPGKPHIMASNIPEPETGDEVSFQLPNPLRHLTKYVWKVRAKAQAADGSFVNGPESDYQVFTTPRGVCRGSGNLGQGIPKEYEVREFVKNLMMDGTVTKEYAKDCRPQPPSQYLNDLMIRVVTELQKEDPCWGYLKKSPPLSPYKTIPRDIVLYAWSGEAEGTHKAFVVDFVNSGCDNDPRGSEFLDRAERANFVWSFLNRADGMVTNGYWSATPDNF